MTTYGGFAVSSDYGPRASGDKFHNGTDVDSPQGTPLYMPRAGTVDPFDDPDAYGWGYVLRFTDARGRKIEMLLGHLSERRFPSGGAVKVPGGTFIGRTGGLKGTRGAGNSTGDHLHVSLSVDGEEVDPETEPGLLHALFNGGIEMTEKELRNLIEFENGQMMLRYSENLDKQGDAIDNDDTARRILKRQANAAKATGERLVEDSKS